MSANAFSGSAVRAPRDAEGRPKLVHLRSQCSSLCGSSLHNGHVRSAAGFNKRAFTLSRGVCPDRKRARLTASAVFMRHQMCRGGVSVVVAAGGAFGIVQAPVVILDVMCTTLNSFK